MRKKLAAEYAERGPSWTGFWTVKAMAAVGIVICGVGARRAGTDE